MLGTGDGYAAVDMSVQYRILYTLSTTCCWFRLMVDLYKRPVL